MSLTAAQKQAVAARGNVLVMAGAGTGKTRTLVERCIDCLINEHPRVSLDEILLVTFTEAAAAEMRERIRARLEQELATGSDSDYWQEQLALFETAKIGTLHSFCLHLVRQHFYELELDPQLVVMPEEEARLLADETLDELLQHYYDEKGERADQVRRVIQSHLRGSDQPLRHLLLRLHKYSQSLPDPEGWLRQQTALFSNPEPHPWREWYGAALKRWRTEATSNLRSLAPSNELAGACLRIIERISEAASIEKFKDAFAAIKGAEDDCPRGKKQKWVKPLTEFFAESKFLGSLTARPGGADPLKEDWDWTRGEMLILLEIAAEFTHRFSDSKRELGVVDFSDLEQHALRLLWDGNTNQTKPAAELWREKLRFVFVDEYQDINAAQDRIIQALSRAGKGNRFLVGDVKQSIYRFRLANPHIFQRYIDDWSRGGALTIPLQENFRSRKEILEIVNSISETWMRPELGGLSYGHQSRLISGLPQRDPGKATHWAVELRLRVKGRVETDEETDSDGTDNSYTELEEAAKEARLIGARLQELVHSKHPVWDENQEDFRPVEWRDIAILLRSPSNKAESYAKEFALLGVPLQVARGGFYDSIEISDLLSVLQVLDNPLQDIPLLAVLRSPLVGLTLDELAEVRLALPKGHFWAALLRWADDHGANAGETSDSLAHGLAAHTEMTSRSTKAVSDLVEKVSFFLTRFARWRRLARQVSLSECLENILNETRYTDFLSLLNRAPQRIDNVRRLIVLAQRFDQLHRQGLFRFLRLIEAQRQVDAEPEASSIAEENAVRLMSIHQSKGLEFPVVVLADLGKPFNLSDLRAEVILDEELGLCPQIKAPGGGGLYPSLAHWLAARHQRRELLGEELRLLYVAMTRARDLLVLSGSTSKAGFQRVWRRGAQDAPLRAHKAQSFADWIGGWFWIRTSGTSQLQGEDAQFRWCIHSDEALESVQAFPRLDGQERSEPRVTSPGRANSSSLAYPYDPATLLPAKTSVSAVRRQLSAAEVDDSAAALHHRASERWQGAGGRAKTLADAVKVGNANHHFLEKVELARTGSQSELEAEARRLFENGFLMEDEIGALDFSALARFWNSDVGRQIRLHATHVRREVPFTFRLGASDLASMIWEQSRPVKGLADEFVVVQGVADLIVALPHEIWLLDFKTDRPRDGVNPASQYEVQIRLYAKALTALYQRPVTNAWLHFLATGETAKIEIAPLRVTERSPAVER